MKNEKLFKVKEFDQFLMDRDRINLDKAENYINKIQNYGNEIIFNACKFFMMCRKGESEQAEIFKQKIYKEVLNENDTNPILHYIKAIFCEFEGCSTKAEKWFDLAKENYLAALDGGISCASDELFKSGIKYSQTPEEFLEKGLNICKDNPSLICSKAKWILSTTHNEQKYFSEIIKSVSGGNAFAIESFCWFVIDNYTKFSNNWQEMAVVLCCYLFARGWGNQRLFDLLIKFIYEHFTIKIYPSNKRVIKFIGNFNIDFFQKICALLYNSKYTKTLALSLMDLLIKTNNTFSEKDYFCHLVFEAEKEYPYEGLNELIEKYKNTNFNKDELVLFEKFTNNIDINKLIKDIVKIKTNI